MSKAVLGFLLGCGFAAVCFGIAIFFALPKEKHSEPAIADLRDRAAPEPEVDSSEPGDRKAATIESPTESDHKDDPDYLPVGDDSVDVVGDPIEPWFREALEKVFDEIEEKYPEDAKKLRNASIGYETAGDLLRDLQSGELYRKAGFEPKFMITTPQSDATPIGDGPEHPNHFRAVNNTKDKCMNLLAPISVGSFPWSMFWGWVKTDDGYWSTKQHVNTKNAFGTDVRYPFLATVNDAGEVIEFYFYGRGSGHLPDFEKSKLYEIPQSVIDSVKTK